MSDRTLTVVVADDDQVRAAGWETSIATAVGLEFNPAVQSLGSEQFAQAVRALRERAKAAKAGGPRSNDAATIFDNADVLVIDNDLTPDPGAQLGEGATAVDEYLSGQTGAEVARLCRAHSLAKVIVVVNEAYRARTFDLTMKRWASSPADVNITVDDLDNSSLWHGNGSEDFAPSDWPRLVGAADGINDMEARWNLDSRLVEILGMTDEQTIDLTDRQLEALSPDATVFTELTLADVLKSDLFGLGDRPKDAPDSSKIALRAAVNGFRRWVARELLPDANVLIDLPHLLSFRPWLQLHRNDAAYLRALEERWYPTSPNVELEAFSEPASALLGRNVWICAALSRPPADARVLPKDLVFCEDSSAFESFETARSFKSDLGGPNATRFVKVIGGVRYSPKGRLFDG